MQDKNNEFDLIVRSMMEDAEEQVPDGVWESVSSSLDRKARRPVILRWGRTAAVAAAAAAVVLGVFVGVRKNTNSTYQNINSLVAESPSSEDSSVAPEQNLIAEAVVPEADPRPAGMDAVRREPVTKKVQSAERQIVVAEEAVTVIDEEDEPADASAGNEMSEPATVPEEDVRTAGQPEEAEEENPGYDTFAQMQLEDSRREAGASRFSVTVGGDLQSNGDPASVNGFRVWKAKGLSNTSGEGIIQSPASESTYAVPLSIGLGVRYNLSRRWSVGTGVTYSLMERTFHGTYFKRENGIDVETHSGEISNTLHYVGIPLNVYCRIIDNNRFSLYAFGGGSVEKAVINNYRIPADDPFNYKEKVDGIQTSLNAGFGVEFMLNDNVGLYVDPSLRYYFDCDQPTSIRTQQPLMMGFEVGLRFDI